jgi:hypothetical protein
MQLEVKGQKLYALTMTNFGSFVGDTIELVSLSYYIKEWRLTIWETAFFQEFKSKDGI